VRSSIAWSFSRGRADPPARACFRLVDEERVTLCVSAPILAEVRDVLTRPKTQEWFPVLLPEWVETFVENVQSNAVVLAEVPQTFRLERDPKDEPYLDLAIATQAHYLVSRDLDLLDLMNDASFRRRYPGLTILGPAAFLHAIAREAQAGGQASKESPEAAHARETDSSEGERAEGKE